MINIQQLSPSRLIQNTTLLKPHYASTTFLFGHDSHSKSALLPVYILPAHQKMPAKLIKLPESQMLQPPNHQYLSHSAISSSARNHPRNKANLSAFSIAKTQARHFHNSTQLYDTKSSQTGSRMPLPENLSAKHAAYLLQFLQNMKPTSVLLHVGTLSHDGSIDKTIFSNMYTGKQQHSGRTSHVEKSIWKEADVIIQAIQNDASNNIGSSSPKIILTLFQSESPYVCPSLSVLQMKRLQSKLQGQLNHSVDFEIHVKDFDDREWDNLADLKNLHQYCNISVQPFNWIRFYDAFTEWVCLQVPSTEAERCNKPALTNKKEVIKYLYEKAQPSLVEFTLQQNKNVECKIKDYIKTHEQKVEDSYKAVFQWVCNQNLADDNNMKRLLENERFQLRLRLNCVLVEGVPEDTGLSDQTLVAEIFNSIGVNKRLYGGMWLWTPVMIMRVPNDNVSPKRIIVKLPNARVKREVLRHWYKVRSAEGLLFDPKKVSIVNNLTILQRLEQGTMVVHNPLVMWARAKVMTL